MTDVPPPLHAPAQPAAASEPMRDSAELPMPGSVRCRIPVLAVGVLLALGLAVAAPYISRWFGLSRNIPVIFGGYLPALPLGMAMALAWGWNSLVRVIRLPRLVLRPWELLCIVGLLFVTVGVTGSSLSYPWSNRLMAKPALEQQSAAKLMADAIPDELSVPYRADNPEVERLYDGLRVGGDGKPMPIAPLVKPTLWSGLLVVFGILLISGLGAMTARQWTHHERLQHPLAQVPLALVDPKILRHSGFRIALALTLGLWLWNLGVGWGFNPLPRIATEFTIPGMSGIFGNNAPGKWVTGLYWASIKIYPAAIGIAFLLTLDLGFSVWGGFWFGVVTFGLLTLSGANVSFESDGRFLGAGATLGMAALILFTGRKHYSRLVLAACGRGKVPEDRSGVWGVRVVMAAIAGIAFLVWFIGGGTWSAAMGAIVAIALLIAFILVIARVVAECGLANFQSAHEMTLVANSLGLPLLLPYQVFTTLIFLGQTLMLDTRENVSGYMVQGVALGEQQGISPGRLHLAFGAMAIVAAIVALIATFAASWTQHGSPISTGMMQVQNVTGLIDQAASATGGPMAFWRSLMLSSPVLLGIVLILAVAFLRRIWVSCPIHPIGLVVAVSWPVYVVWGSLMLGWLAKWLSMRYGGVGLYRRLKPVAIGLILGDVLGYCLQFVVIASAKGWGHSLEIWRNPP